MKNTFLSILIILLVIITSCNNPNSDLDFVFRKIDDALTKSEKQELIKIEDIDSIVGFTLLNSNLRCKQVFENGISNELINKLDSMNIVYPAFTLIRAYQKNKKNQNYSLKNLDNEIQNCLKRKDSLSKLRMIRNYKEYKRIAKLNYNKFNKNDTICLIFPVTYTSRKWAVDYALADKKDELFYLTASLIKKKIIMRTDYLNNKKETFKFELKIIDLSKKECFWMSKELKINGEFNIEISHYRREMFSNCSASREHYDLIDL